MAIGVVKWFDPKKGFGFVLNDQGEDVFVHYSSIEGEGFRCLKTGQKVVYRQIGSDKGLQAAAVQFFDKEDAATMVDNTQETETV